MNVESRKTCNRQQAPVNVSHIVSLSLQHNEYIWLKSPQFTKVCKTVYSAAGELNSDRFLTEKFG